MAGLGLGGGHSLVWVWVGDLGLGVGGQLRIGLRLDMVRTTAEIGI